MQAWFGRSLSWCRKASSEPLHPSAAIPRAPHLGHALPAARHAPLGHARQVEVEAQQGQWCGAGGRATAISPAWRPACVSYGDITVPSTRPPGWRRAVCRAGGGRGEAAGRVHHLKGRLGGRTRSTGTSDRLGGHVWGMCGMEGGREEGGLPAVARGRVAGRALKMAGLFHCHHWLAGAEAEWGRDRVLVPPPRFTHAGCRGSTGARVPCGFDEGRDVGRVRGHQGMGAQTYPGAEW